MTVSLRYVQKWLFHSGMSRNDCFTQVCPEKTFIQVCPEMTVSFMHVQKWLFHSGIPRNVWNCGSYVSHFPEMPEIWRLIFPCLSECQTKWETGRLLFLSAWGNIGKLSDHSSHSLALPKQVRVNHVNKNSIILPSCPEPLSNSWSDKNLLAPTAGTHHTCVATL